MKNKQQLYHGTSIESAKSILDNGFTTKRVYVTNYEMAKNYGEAIIELLIENYDYINIDNESFDGDIEIGQAIDKGFSMYIFGAGLNQIKINKIKGE